MAVARGVRVAEVYVDTVGPPDKYQAKLEALFPDLKVCPLLTLKSFN